jgi:hypothetical protein
MLYSFVWVRVTGAIDEYPEERMLTSAIDELGISYLKRWADLDSWASWGSARCVFLVWESARCVFLVWESARCVFLVWESASCVSLVWESARCVFLVWESASCVSLVWESARCVFLAIPLFYDDLLEVRWFNLVLLGAIFGHLALIGLAGNSVIVYSDCTSTPFQRLGYTRATMAGRKRSRKFFPPPFKNGIKEYIKLKLTRSLGNYSLADSP